MKRLLLLLTFLSLSQVSTAQLTVTNNQTPADLVQNVLLGAGITVSNIKFNGTPVNATLIRDQAGFFNNGSTTNMGINSGVILASGQVLGSPPFAPVEGPNDSPGQTTPSATPFMGDPDLALLSSATVTTAAILEFDFVPLGENLSFNYVFGSDEYPEFVPSFNDVFGFFLSGPGISGPYTNGAINIAIVPGTLNTPVSIYNVNNGSANAGPCVNCAYYVNNNLGATPSIQYDGFTTVLTAAATVQCGETYHIKLAISNVGDSALDSGVFLQGGSFNTTPITLPSDYLIGGDAPCPGVVFDICSGLDPSVIHEWTVDGVVIPG
ncbi:MAG TPA: choice-of-anchor L domain-containing protein, partial [Flavobacterium sp.]